MIFSIPLLLVVEEFILNRFALNTEAYFRVSTLIASCLLFIAFIQLEIYLSNRFSQYWDSCRMKISWFSSWTLGIFCLNPLVIKIVNGLNIFDFPTAYFGVDNLTLFFKATVFYFIAIALSYFISRIGGARLVR